MSCRLIVYKLRIFTVTIFYMLYYFDTQVNVKYNCSIFYNLFDFSSSENCGNSIAFQQLEGQVLHSSFACHHIIFEIDMLLLCLHLFTWFVNFN